MEKWANRYCKDFISRVDIKTREGATSFVTVADTTTSAAAASGDLTVTITLATGWPSSGLCLIDGYPTTFTRSSTTLTVPALPRDFESGDIVQLAYAVPTDFMRPRSIFVEGTEYVFAKKGATASVPLRGLAIYSDYFVFPVAITGSQEVLIHYAKKGTNTLTSSSTMEIMDLFDSYVIFMLVGRGHRIMYDEDRAQSYEAQAMKEMKIARNYFAKADGTIHNAFIPGF